MRKRGSRYASIIIEATHCSEEDAAEIEDIMRHDIFHSTLDWQTKEELMEAAKKAEQIKDNSAVDKAVRKMKESK